MNLNAAASAGPPADTFAGSIEVYDSLGVSHIVSVNFTKSVNPGEWAYSVSIPNSDVTAPVTPVTGTINFDTSGQLVNPPVTGPFPALAITGLASGAADMTITWNLYNGANPRLTQFAQTSAISAIGQDGNPAAQLIRVGLGDSGSVLAQYSNGEQVLVGQLAMASVRNPESLLSVGNNAYQLSGRSALPAIGLPGTGGRGTILGGAIENSTVDIAREFTNLIILQRGYQANSRVITTVDELSQETINLKR
jgi:flagellar hook protein FlgE